MLLRIAVMSDDRVFCAALLALLHHDCFEATAHEVDDAESLNDYHLALLDARATRALGICTQLAVAGYQADLQIVKTSDALVYKPSSLIAYTITVANNGPSDAKAVVVTNTLPPTQQALYQSNTGGCTLAGAVLTCQLGDMALGTTRSFNVYLVVKGSRGQVTNTASVGSATTDPNATNNSSIRVVTVGK